jgi:hypothetical protein
MKDINGVPYRHGDEDDNRTEEDGVTKLSDDMTGGLCRGICEERIVFLF